MSFLDRIFPEVSGLLIFTSGFIFLAAGFVVFASGFFAKDARLRYAKAKTETKKAEHYNELGRIRTHRGIALLVMSLSAFIFMALFGLGMGWMLRYSAASLSEGTLIMGFGLTVLAWILFGISLVLGLTQLSEKPWRKYEQPVMATAHLPSERFYPLEEEVGEESEGPEY